MARVLFLLVALLAIAVGLVVGTLNPAPASLDLLWITFDLPLGLLALMCFGAGLLLGVLICWGSSVWPLRRQLRRAEARLENSASGQLTPPDA